MGESDLIKFPSRELLAFSNRIAKGADFDTLRDLLLDKKAIESSLKTLARSKKRSKETDLMLLSGQIMAINGAIERLLQRHAL